VTVAFLKAHALVRKEICVSQTHHHLRCPSCGDAVYSFGVQKGREKQRVKKGGFDTYHYHHPPPVARS
jgi:Fe2+ or Zn2+ uptake regulation protein